MFWGMSERKRGEEEKKEEAHCQNLPLCKKNLLQGILLRIKLKQKICAPQNYVPDINYLLFPL